MLSVTAKTLLSVSSCSQISQLNSESAWLYSLKDGAHIGELCFKGLSADGVAEIGYGISEEYQNNGYATEVVKAVLEWAFSHPEVIAIEAETESENAASISVLKKCGFALNGIIGEEGPRWAISKC